MVNNIIKCLLVSFSLCLFYQLSAQQKMYSTFKYNMDILLQDSTQRDTLKLLERQLYRSSSFVLENEKSYSFSIVYHNLTDWTEDHFNRQVNFQHNALNRDFSVTDESNPKVMPVGITFDYGINSSVDINKKEWLNWNNSKQKMANSEIHIWVIDLPDTIGSYASWPEGNSDIDGIVIDHAYFGQGEYPEYNQGKTLSTLVAMHFGLKPLLGINPCADDGVRDTPRYEFNIACNDIGVSRCDGEEFMPDNIMSPTTDACRAYFTTGQVYRMKYFIENTYSLTNKIKN